MVSLPQSGNQLFVVGLLNPDQERLSYSFCLDEVVRPITGCERSLPCWTWVHSELAPHDLHVGRPLIDPVLMIGMPTHIRACRRDVHHDGSGRSEV
jgi:hypothetical protein